MATAVKTVTVTLTLTDDDASLLRRALLEYVTDRDIDEFSATADEIRAAISVALYPF